MLDLSATSAADRVYEAVKELILTNAIAGGEPVSYTHLTLPTIYSV